MRRLFTFLLLVATVLASIASALTAGRSAGAAGSRFRGSAGPTQRNGPFAVGKATVTFVDGTRPTPSFGSYPGSPVRTLVTTVYYPIGFGHPSERRVPAENERFPLVIFAHGNSSSGPDNQPLLRQWASAGFVVAAPTFPMTNIDAPGGDDVGDYVHQPGDISFVITQLLHPSRRSGAQWRGMVDPTSIGVVGHSLGAITTLGVTFNSCCQDSRIEAAVSIDGIELPFPNGAYFTGSAKPLLVIHGSADQTIPYAAGQQTYADASPPKFFVTLLGAPHTSFHQTNDPNSPRRPWQPVIVHAVTDFFDYYLKDQPEALRQMAADARVPGVSSLSFETG